MKTALFLSALASISCAAADAEPVLDERVLALALESAKLSTLAYIDSTEYAILDADGNVTGYEHPDYDEISFYTQEPDQAIVAKIGGRCFIAFRGTSATASDWEENLDIREDMAYKNDDMSSGEFCKVRRGYSDFLRTDLVDEAYQTILNCSQTCTDLNDCVIITGHSQGAASAAVASILVYDLMPTLFTFGMPPAAQKDCTLIPSQRLYRFVNHRKEIDEDDDLGFDPVPFVPALFSHSVHYGYYLLVGPDKTSAKYLGLDQNYTFTPTFEDRTNEVAAHTMGGTNYSYTARIEGLLETGKTIGFPVSIQGFSEGTPCEPHYSELCESNDCVQNLCGVPSAELCVKGSCERDQDCSSGRCIYGACATGDGEVDGGCPCKFNRDCKSGDCDHKLFSLDWVCEPGESDIVSKVDQLCIEGSCEVDDDCESGFCVDNACAEGAEGCDSGDTSAGAHFVYLKALLAMVLPVLGISS